MDLTNQRVVIMGGSSGIGLATAHMLVAAGANVAILGRNHEKINKAVAHLGERASGAVVDATSHTHVHKFFQDYGTFQHLVIAVSGAGGAGAFHNLNLNALRRGFDAKFWAHITVAQASLATLQRDGSLTFITAGSARAAFAETVGLAAINGALNAMIPTLALELRPLRVNAVSPGLIATPWWDQVPAEFREAHFAKTAAAVPVGRVGQPDEVAQVIVFLIQNGFMTGTIIDCDGGARIR